MQLSYHTGLREYFKVPIDRAQRDIRYSPANLLVNGVSRGMPPRRIEFFEDKTSLTSHPKPGGFGVCLYLVHNSNHYCLGDCILALSFPLYQVGRTEMRFFCSAAL